MGKISLGVIIRVLDILSSVLTIICLNLVYKTYKIWIVYTFASVMFTTVMFLKHLPGLTIMGLILICTGIKNYLEGRKHESSRHPKHEN